MSDLPPLWRHQRDAIDACISRRGSLLHMGLGTGKTRVTVELLERWGAKVAIVVCPLSVAPTWPTEIGKYATSRWRVLNLCTGGGVRGNKVAAAEREMREAAHRGERLLLVLNYEAVYRAPFGAWAIRQGFDALVVDEAHRLKAPKGVQSKYVWKLSATCKRVVALTGTPMPAGPMDAFAQFRIIAPQLFGTSYFRFRSRYAKMGGYGGHEVVGYQRMDEFRDLLASATYQVGRDVLDLPDATHTTIDVPLGKRGRAIYDELERALRVEIEEGTIDVSNALVKLIRLQQLTGGVASTDDGLAQVDTSKEDALVDLLGSVDDDEPFVVFGQYRSDLAAIHRAAERLGRSSMELSGAVNQLSEWQGGGAPILAVQIHSGGAGINLTRACYVAYYSTGFNGGDYEQSLARAHRPGQDRAVSFYHLHAHDTIDARVFRALASKKKVVDAILEDLS